METMKPTTAMAVALAAVETFRNECRTDLGTQTVSCFLHVAMRSEIPMFDLIELLGLSNAAVSRNINVLGDGTPKKPGLKLVKAREDRGFRRRKIVTLTPLGRALARKVVAAMNNVRGL
jgi:DNA-binding MarR family transcriptional regulator